MEGESKPPPAGWYVDPDDAALQRFWDGSRWTNSRMPRNEGVLLEGDVHQPATVAVGRPAPASTDSDARSALPPAAWYDDPENSTGMRYWDGSAWTEHRTSYRVPPPKKSTGEGMVIAGYVLAFMLPIVGFILGVMLMTRSNKHGVYVLGLSLLCFVGFFFLGQSIDTPEN